MIEITNIALENEMDLILVHKQAMKLAEVTGLSIAAQTTFATAVSEISRSALARRKDAVLALGVSAEQEKKKMVMAVLHDKSTDLAISADEGFRYARRLVTYTNVQPVADGNLLELGVNINARVDNSSIEKWRIVLNNDPAVTPYEEIKRKNKQLLEMTERLQASELQYKSLANSLPLLIYSITTEGEVLYANDWTLRYLGRSIKEVNADRWESVVHPDDFKEAWSQWGHQSRDKHAIITRERRLKDASTGEYRWHKGVSIAIASEDGTVKWWNTYMVDIHAQKTVEQMLIDNQQLKQLHTELEEKVKLLDMSNQQLRQYAYVASHDLQEPLRKISFYSDFLKNKYRTSLPDDALSFFDNLINATERMRILIQDILTYSIVQKDSFTLVDLNQIVGEVENDLEISIKEKSAVLEVSGLPHIEGNAQQIKQLFENLISNSIKFSQQNIPPHISIGATVDGDSVLLTLNDNGIGFEEQYSDKMFDIFQRLHNRNEYSGNGVGLSICKKIVDYHNGTIGAKGTPGKGASFSIMLPLKQTGEL